jgi:hypothetical protein
MLGAWERLGFDEVIERVEGGGGDAGAKLRRVSAIALYGEEVLRIDRLSIDLAIRDWARRDKKVARRLRRVDNRRMDFMRSLFAAFVRDEDDVEARCLLAFSLWIGSHFIAADHGARSSADAQELAFGRLLDALPCSAN